MGGGLGTNLRRPDLPLSLYSNYVVVGQHGEDSEYFTASPNHSIEGKCRNTRPNLEIILEMWEHRADPLAFRTDYHKVDMRAMKRVSNTTCTHTK